MEWDPFVGASKSANIAIDPAGTAAERIVAGCYRLSVLLGTGGMGAVWPAQVEVLQRAVALKQLTKSQRAEGSSALRRPVHWVDCAPAGVRESSVPCAGDDFRRAFWAAGGSICAQRDSVRGGRGASTVRYMHGAVSHTGSSSHAGALGVVLDGLLDKDPSRRMDASRARRHLQPMAPTQDGADHAGTGIDLRHSSVASKRPDS
jgi:hypothetical protein